MDDHPTGPGHQDGFTLIEVLVALAIAGVAFTLAFQIFSGASFLAAADLRQDDAVNVLDSELARVGRDVPLVDGTVHGVTTEGYSWQIDIMAQGQEEQLAVEREALKQVTVTVVWFVRRQQHYAHLVTLRLAPRI